MHAAETILIVCLGFFLFGLFSNRLRMSPITPPMAFTLLGLSACPSILGIGDFDIAGPAMHMVAELTLALVLFTDATRMDLRKLGKEHDLPLRMLFIGMPLTLLLGAAGAWLLFPGIGLWGAAVLSAMLAPTDAALGQAVTTEPGVPARIRQTLNVESGLNDGLALPVFLFVLACFESSQAGKGAGPVAGDFYWFAFAGKQLIFGPLAGALVGAVGGRIAGHFADTGSMGEDFQRLCALILAFGAYGLAVLLGGNGFIAAFTAGLTLGAHHCGLKERIHEFGETEGELFTLLIFLLFGEAMVSGALFGADWRIFVYAGLSLTVFRMLPVWLSLRGLGLMPSTTLFLGWFGPRGIASILFALVLFEEAGSLSGGVIRDVTTVTVFFSVLLHGLTAYPLSQMYGRSLANMPEDDEEEMMEHMPVPELRTRTRHDA